MDKDENRNAMVPLERHSPPTKRGGLRDGGRTIMVNGRSHLIAADSISHESLVRLAFPELERSESRALTVTYHGGPLQASEGLLTRHQRTPIAEGETFVVAQTSAS